MPITAITTDPAMTAEGQALLYGWTDGPAACAVTTDAQGLHQLLAWTSPSFPIGAFSYSHGLEQAVEDGTVGTAETLAAWIDGVLRFGAGRTDAGFAVRAARQARAGDMAGLVETAIVSSALVPAGERALEARQQGRSFLDAVARGWALGKAADLTAQLDAVEVPVTLPVAAGACGGWAGLPEDMLIEALVHAFAANLVSAGVRLVPLGQTDGQRVLAALGPVIGAVATAARARPEAAPGGAAILADIAALRHETLYSRLFRS